LTSNFPEHGFAWKVLGSVLRSLGRPEESLAVQIKTVALRPSDHEAHFNLACEYHQQGRLDEAVKCYFSALSIQPKNAIAYSNLGNILKTLGHFPVAEACCREAIALEPEMAYAHNNLGNALHAQGKLKDAEASYDLALSLKPDWAEAYNNLAIALKDQGQWTRANDCYRKALSILPSWAAAHSNLLYCLSLDVHTTPQQLFAEHVAFGEQFEAPLRANWQPHHNTKDPARRLQVGFVSGDLYNHAVTSFLEPVLRFLANRQSLNLHAYYTHVIEDPVSERLQTYFSHWHAVASLSDAELADKIRADGIDILIDLSSHTAHNRLLTFARKPAPIQATWMGYPGTTGLQAMDYHFCDRFWIPPGEMDWQFTEKSAFLPASAIFQPSEHAPAVSGLPALKNRTNKINSSVIVLWSMLLRSLPDARMLLAAVPPDSQDALIRSFADEGIEPDRLIFYPRASMADYLALHHQVDICLDTFPYSGGTTIHHAAWMGVPTLTLAGETPASRAGASEMHFWGLDGFIADSIDDFISKGRYWAGQFSELAAIRASTRARLAASPLGQPEPYAASFELILRTMWLRWCDNLPAALIDVGTTNP
jgi:protein O-GlcNAc transferase